METKAAAKVGLMILVGAALAVAAWGFLSHLNLNHYRLYAIFDNTNGLSKQSPLRMNGVTIGDVESVDLQLDLRPKITLSISDRYKNRIPIDSVIRISSGLLIANPQIEIMPGKSTQTYADGEMWRRVEKQPLSGLAQVSPEADQAAKELAYTIRTLTPKLTTTMTGLQGILKRTDAAMTNIEAATRSARSLIADPKLRRTLNAMEDDLQTVSLDARRTASVLSTELRSVVKRNSTKIDELTNGAVDLLQKFADTVDAARGAITKLTEQVSDPRLQESLVETVDLAKTTIARFNQIASDIHNLTGDPDVQNDLKASVASLKETTTEGQKLVEQVSSLVGKISSAPRRPRLGIGRPELTIDLLGRGNAQHFRSDVGVRLPIGQHNAIDLGVYNFAEADKVNAQYETDVRGLGALRYGIYASKLGVGLSWPSATGTQFRLDAYNPNDFQLDARALFRINDDFSLWLGADSLFKRTTPLIGIRLSR